MLLQLFHVWRDFFIVTATAAATLIGSMFVVVSIASGILTRERSAAAHAYLTSTVVHLGAVLLASILTMAPSVTWFAFGIVLAVGGAVGIAYVAMLSRAVAKFSVDWTDTLWYSALPFLGYAALTAAGVLSIVANFHAVELLATASVLVLICGMHNAWDMILIFATRPRAPDADKKLDP